MSVETKLIIDEKETNVLRFSFGFHQVADTNGRPSLSSSTYVINDFTLKVQTPKGLFDLLTNSAKYTYGKNRKKQLTVTKKYLLIFLHLI